MNIELHCHTSESSPCAQSCASEAVTLYVQNHFDTLVITNHYNNWALEQTGLTIGNEYTDYFLNGYRQAKAFAQKNALPLNILLGAEVTLSCLPNDYLLYGADEAFFYQHPDLMSLSLEQLSILCHQNDILLYQAHPFRTYCEAVFPEYLDGIEVYNGNPRHKSFNEKAKAWAQKENKWMSSGSDFHQPEDVGLGGIITSTPVITETDLCQVLKEGRYQFIEGNK